MHELKHTAIGLSCILLLLHYVGPTRNLLIHDMFAVRSRQVHSNQLCGNRCQLA